MDLISDVFNFASGVSRSKDAVVYKENSDLQDRYDALEKLVKDFPDNEELLTEYFIIKKGLTGENEILYQLKKSSIGLCVLRDVKFKFEDLSAQIDYIIITPAFTYLVECKNLVGNITVNEKGDFIREFTINNHKIKKGMYSPLRQVEAQREVLRKIREKNSSKLLKLLNSQNFNYYTRVLVAAANSETILNTSKAPKDIKYKVIRADALVRQLEYDIEHRDKDDLLDSQKEMEIRAKRYLEMSVQEEIDYYEFYKSKFHLSNGRKNENDDGIKERMIAFRKERAAQTKMPAYYIFTNDELEKLLAAKPKTLEELEKTQILPPIKVKTHGVAIIEALNA